MVIVIEELFVEQLQKCPISFQQKFRLAYQPLKIVEKPTDVKNIVVNSGNKDFYKLYIEESRIGMMIKDSKLYILCFLYNQYFE
jgi:mRNA-degrading endonuclease RelE of RelBE toxin-antitoxin system